MSEMDFSGMLRPINRNADAPALSQPAEMAYCEVVYLLSEQRRAWNNTTYQAHRGTESLFEDNEDADNAIEAMRTSGSFFKASAKLVIKVRSGDDYLIFAHINTPLPFKRWSNPEGWGRLNRPPTLDEVLTSFRPAGREPGKSGWPAGMQNPDMVIGITASPVGHRQWTPPLQMQMENFSSKGVRPGYADDGFRHLKSTGFTNFTSEDVRLSVLSLNEAIAGRS